MPTPDPLPDLSGLSLAEIARLAAEQKLRPIESWNPERRGQSEMRIARDGTWYHQGLPIRRPAMVSLFSTLLRKEGDGRFVLVTPVEMLDIEVEDCPFTAVEFKSEGEGADRMLAFRLNTGDLVVAGPDNPIIFGTGETPHPVVRVRGELDALISRAPYYELVDLALEEASASGGEPGLWSKGRFFPLDSAA